MGCHTWCYRKIERTQEYAKESCIKNLKTERNLYWKIYNNPNYLGVNWYTTKQEQIKIIDVLNRKIRMVSNYLCKRAVWNNQNDDEINVYVDGKGLFIADTNFHNLFRVGYVKTKLFSLEETLDFIKNNECTNIDNESIINFWNKYPDGMIDFG